MVVGVWCFFTCWVVFWFVFAFLFASWVLFGCGLIVGFSLVCMGVCCFLLVVVVSVCWEWFVFSLVLICVCALKFSFLFLSLLRSVNRLSRCR